MKKLMLGLALLSAACQSFSMGTGVEPMDNSIKTTDMTDMTDATQTMPKDMPDEEDNSL